MSYAGNSAGKERVMLFLLTDSGQRAMPGSDHSVAWQGKDLLLIIPILIFEVRGASAHRAGEDRIGYDRQRPAEASDVESRHAG